MVGVADCVCDDIPCLIPAISIFVKKNTHQFRDTECGVCVIDVDCNTVCKVVKRRIGLKVTLDDALD